MEINRILIVDDNPSIHEDFKRILSKNPKNELDNIQEILFGKKGNAQSIDALFDFKIDSAFQGEEAVKLVQEASLANNPYALAFVDIRMPPGWDGINTIKHLWNIDPSMQVVICTAYSDYSWQDMFNELNSSENFLILKKPFDAIEVRQLTVSLIKKWEYKRRIQQKVDNLEAAVLERTQQLRRALTLAEDANQLKNKFLGNVSQELRVPLNAIIGFAELMYDGKADKNHFQEYCSDILSSAKYLLQMIIDIVDMSELELKTIQFYPEKINLNRLIDELKDIFSPLITEKKLKFSSVIDPTLTHVVIDPIKFKQILRHYVSNAIKFTANGGEIEIHITPSEEGQLQIEVTDTGIGIREEDQHKLFNPFQQIDLSMSKRYHGTGLGLALTRRLVELQGGKVGVKSTFGKGSTFYAVLPYVSI